MMRARAKETGASLLYGAAVGVILGFLGVRFLTPKWIIGDLSLMVVITVARNWPALGREGVSGENHG